MDIVNKYRLKFSQLETNNEITAENMDYANSSFINAALNEMPTTLPHYHDRLLSGVSTDGYEAALISLIDQIISFTEKKFHQKS